MHYHPKITYENIVQKDMNKFEEKVKNKEKEFLLGHDANQMIDRDERTRLSYAI